jgi:hypothetical protein
MGVIMYHVSLNVTAGIAQRRVINKVNKTDCGDLKQILPGMPRYGNRWVTKEHLAHLVQIRDRRVLDDLFRTAGQEHCDIANANEICWHNAAT